MAEIFISYSRDDRALVRTLAEAVARAGYSVWWDEELPPHLSYGDVIAQEIGGAKAAIVVWSASAAASQWVRAEADLARNQKKLIQTSIDGRMPPMPFDQLHFVTIGDWRGEEDHPGWRKVKESLAALCGGGDDVRPAYPMPTMPPPPQRQAFTLAQRLLAGLVAILLLIILAGGALLWMRGTPVAPPASPIAAAPPPPAKPAPVPEAASAPEPAPHRAAARPAAPAHRAAPAPAEPRRPVNLRQAYRYCMGRGRGSAECAELRRRYGR